MENMEKVSRVVIQPVRDLTLRVHLKLFREKDGRKEAFHNVFTVGDKGYMKVDLQSFLTLEVTSGIWARDKSIFIDERNIYQLVRGFKQALDAIYDGGVFAVNKKGDPVIYKDKQEEHTVKIYNLGMNQRMVVTPSIIYDENDMSYEGVVMFFNKYENYIELPIDAFEALYYKLKKIDLFVYSQMLLNYYLLAMKADQEKLQAKKVEIEAAEKPKRKPNVFEPPKKEKEFVKSTVPKDESPEEFFGVKEKS